MLIFCETNMYVKLILSFFNPLICLFQHKTYYCLTLALQISYISTINYHQLDLFYLLNLNFFLQIHYKYFSMLASFIVKGQYILGMVVTGMALIAAIAVTITDVTNQDKSVLDDAKVVPFAFDVYCPIDNNIKLNILNFELAKLGFEAINFDYTKDSQTFVIYVQAKSLNASDPKAKAALYYCGLARKWTDSDCTNARVICSIPGPMFYFAVKQAATIIWVNQIHTEKLNWIQEDCYIPNSLDNQCTLKAKSFGQQKCTFLDPTNYFYNLSTHRLTKQSIPISPHIHGSYSRPMFDGNPLSWFNTKGDKGPGYNTLFNQLYFQLFHNQEIFKGIPYLTKSMSNRMKIIRVSNDQSPGLMFYHDHAMKSTKYNVGNGLSGLYVIYDPKIQAQLPKGNQMKFILFSQLNDGDARSAVIINPESGVANLTQADTLSAINTYRLRFLNAHFDNSFYSIQLVAYYKQKNINGETSVQQVNPSQKNYDLSRNKHPLKFSIIGADTSLFDRHIHDLTTFDMGPAERVDMLIRFDQSLIEGINNVYLICLDNNAGKLVIKHKFKITKEPQQFIYKKPKEYGDFKVPFTDLSLVSNSDIAIQRHRPLFTLPKDKRFMLGAHYMFQMGASQNPQIGTIEDYYIINNLWQGHPMHFHLINFQIMKSFSLKFIPGPGVDQQCTFYMLDFFRQTGLNQFQNKTNFDLCSYIWGMQDAEVLNVFEQMNNYLKQNQFTITSNGKISGLDVLEASNGNINYITGKENCPLDSTHKYVCSDVSSTLMPHQKRWKDTALVDPYTVFVIRIRWASNNYSDPTMQTYPYFSIPESQLVQFPGFVYHCHILPHQDNEMMRPIVLSFSQKYLDQYDPAILENYCDNRNWQLMMTCLNTKNQCYAR